MEGLLFAGAQIGGQSDHERQTHKEPLFLTDGPPGPYASWVCAPLSCQYANMTTWVVELAIWQLGLPQVLTVPWMGAYRIEGAPTDRICIHKDKKAERNSQWHHQTPLLTETRIQAANMSWTKRQLQAVVTFFHRPIRSRPKL
jgi:hypothetical protein